MLVAIISDIHDNLVNLKKCLVWCRENNIEKIICCGDITNSETLEYLSNSFSKEIILVRGNMEIYEEGEENNFSNFKYLGRYGVAEIEGKKIGACHEPFLIEKVSGLRDCDFIFYGHTHKPFLEVRDKTQIVNPGTLGGVFQRATFAVWDTENRKLELKLLETL
jgi:hypothetical protein